MEVKPGYKQTEVGVIPEEWEVQPLGELSDFVTSGSRGWAQFYSESGALFIRSQNVRDGRLSFEDVQYVTPPTGAEGNRTKVRLNDLLITITGNSVGNVALVEQTFDEAYISQHVGLVRLKEPSRGAYVCRYLSPNSPGNPQIAGSQSGQSKPGLNLQNLKDFQIALPPTLSELQAIATALSDVDGLLGGLDRLIAKKRDLKQAAMQQLLTGQTRLPGFHGEWEVKRLGEVAMLKNGYAFKSDTYTSLGTFKIITIASVQDGYMTTDACNTIADEPADLQPHQRLRRGDILISMTGNVGRVCRVNEDHCLLNQRVGKLVPVGVIEALLFVLLGQPSFISAMTGVAKGGAQPNLSASDITEHTFNIPKDEAEQTAIAEVLSEMDGELAVLEQRREKTRALKQAMMQELLTGRTRLV